MTVADMCVWVCAIAGSGVILYGALIIWLKVFEQIINMVGVKRAAVYAIYLRYKKGKWIECACPERQKAALDE